MTVMMHNPSGNQPSCEEHLRSSGNPKMKIEMGEIPIIQTGPHSAVQSRIFSLQPVVLGD